MIFLRKEKSMCCKETHRIRSSRSNRAYKPKSKVLCNKRRKERHSFNHFYKFVKDMKTDKED